ncbi:hypothetical protein ALC57_07285 [Trachymyrmex cornetzi]|uniref:Uncharacterized protein n=1 Tax=Trachymyrmex cornetzi TaxID=471704 RepID=A0A195E5B5_9HYME|nr:hypothetical protein ALC57_07285 [Trachymyrmex cornetzi]
MLDGYEVTGKSWFLNQLAFVIIGAARREDGDVAPLDWIGLFYWIESANYAKTWRSASRFVQYIVFDRFSWSPLKYHAVRFTAVHSVRRSAYISSREDRSISKLRGFLAGGFNFPQVCCQNIGDSW